MKGTLIALSSLAPQYLLSQSSWQAKQYRLQPQSHSNSCSNAASAQQDLASEELSTKGTPDVTQDSEVASQIEVLNVLVSLLEGASGTLGLLLAASLFRLVFCTFSACKAAVDHCHCTARQHSRIMNYQ